VIGSVRFRIRLLVVVGVVTLMAVGCSSTPSLTVEEYANEATAITEAYVVEAQTLSLAYQRNVEKKVADIVDAGTSSVVDEATELVRVETVNHLALLNDAVVRYHEAMAELEPPDSIRDDHDAYVTIVESVQSTIPALRDAVGEADSIPGIQAALSGSGFSDGQLAWVATCERLEQSVRDEGHGIDLKCARQDVAIGGAGSP